MSLPVYLLRHLEILNQERWAEVEKGEGDGGGGGQSLFEGQAWARYQSNIRYCDTPVIILRPGPAFRFDLILVQGEGAHSAPLTVLQYQSFFSWELFSEGLLLGN